MLHGLRHKRPAGELPGTTRIILNNQDVHNLCAPRIRLPGWQPQHNSLCALPQVLCEERHSALTTALNTAARCMHVHKACKQHPTQVVAINSTACSSTVTLSFRSSSLPPPAWSAPSAAKEACQAKESNPAKQRAGCTRQQAPDV